MSRHLLTDDLLHVGKELLTLGQRGGRRLAVHRRVNFILPWRRG